MNMINTMNILNSNIISMVILVMVLANIHFFNKRLHRSMRFFLYLIGSVFFLLVADSVAWISLGQPGPTPRAILYWSKYFFLLFNTLPSTLWSLYILNGFSRKKPGYRTYLIFSVSTLLYGIFFIVAMRRNIVFYIDEKNLFHRNWGIYVTMTVVYMNMIFMFFYALYKRKYTKGNSLTIIAVISILPLAGGGIQMIFYGLSTTWPFTTLSVLMVYVFLEIQKHVNDYLTGLMNRRQFEELVKYRMEKRSNDRDFTLIVLDMDDFKSINDNFGHHAGDRALQEAANLITRSIGVNDKAGRMGGDEFVVLLDSGSDEIIGSVVSRLRKNFDHWNKESDEPYKLAISLGWAVYDSGKHHDYSALFRQADIMMYSDKRSARN